MKKRLKRYFLVGVILTLVGELRYLFSKDNFFDDLEDRLRENYGDERFEELNKGEYLKKHKILIKIIGSVFSIILWPFYVILGIFNGFGIKP